MRALIIEDDTSTSQSIKLVLGFQYDYEDWLHFRKNNLGDEDLPILHIGDDLVILEPTDNT